MCLVIYFSSDWNHLFAEQMSAAGKCWPSDRPHLLSRPDLDLVVCGPFVWWSHSQRYSHKNQLLAGLSRSFSFIILSSVFSVGQMTSHLSCLGKPASLALTKREYRHCLLWVERSCDSYLSTSHFPSVTPNAKTCPWWAIWREHSQAFPMPTL